MLFTVLKSRVASPHPMPTPASNPRTRSLEPGDPSTRKPIFSSRPWEFDDPALRNPKAPKETIVATARKHTVEAIETLVFHMRSRDPSVSMEAAKELLNRGWGKPPQVMGVISGPGDPLSSAGQPQLSLEEKIKILTAVADGVPPDELQPALETVATPADDVLA